MHASPESPSRPHLLVTADGENESNSVEQLRQQVRAGLMQRMWAPLHAKAQHDAQTAPLRPDTHLPGRNPAQAKQANRDSFICQAAGRRLLRAALAHLITGDTSFRDSALRQLESLFDPEQWPEWTEKSARRPDFPANLRTGMLGQSVALAYDWLHAALDAAQRRWIADGLTRYAIEPYRQSLANNVWWAHANNNWQAVIVGGLGIVGMALDADHPRSAELIEFADARMSDYLQIFGEAGEFNESVGYVGSMSWPIIYFSVQRDHRGDGDDPLARWPFPEACYWQMYMTQPPGRTVLFGDGWVNAPARVDYISAVAAGAREPVLQWLFEQYYEPDGDDPLPLVWYDPTLQSAPPDGRLPRGRAYHAHGKIVSSRSSWDAASAASVVHAKAGRERNHEHHDMGQVCIDGHAQRLIVDLGAPSFYPPDFFSRETRWHYYNAAAHGHNVLTFGGREMNDERQVDRGRIVECEFDDARGGWWRMDTTDAYDEAVRRVRRTVVHLLPNVVAVLDEATLAQPERISLRWHTIDRALPDAQGHFHVIGEHGAPLAGRIIALDAAPLTIQRGEHGYEPPHDKDRLGEPLKQRHESYIEAALHADQCRLLTLFAVDVPAASLAGWAADEDHAWSIETSTGAMRVGVREQTLEVRAADPAHGWCVSLDA